MRTSNDYFKIDEVSRESTDPSHRPRLFLLTPAGHLGLRRGECGHVTNRQHQENGLSVQSSEEPGPPTASMHIIVDGRPRGGQEECRQKSQETRQGLNFMTSGSSIRTSRNITKRFKAGDRWEKTFTILPEQ